MSEVRSVMPAPAAAAVRAAADARARELKAAGDERPLGMLRAVVLHDLVTRPWEERPAVSAHVAVVASLDTLESAAAGAPGTGLDPVAVDGQPVTASQARELLERLDALCPGGLQAPTGGTLDICITDADGRLVATATRGELERVVRRGCGDHPDGECGCPVLGMPPRVDRYAARSGAATVRQGPRSHLPAPRLFQPAGWPTWTTSSRTPAAARRTAPTCAACAAGITG